MSAPGATLLGFAYGEHLEGVPPRSLGYRLLAPVEPEPWCAEVESLARRLQGAPYPDHWPPAELFCSVLLGDGRRLIATARYGLVDHTPSHRRGGLELIGVLGPGNLGVSSAVTVYHWLRQRRAAAEDLRSLGGRFALGDVLSAVSPRPVPTDPVPVLPVRLWQEGALLFAATAPSDPDRRLGLLEEDAGAAWQWLPLVGADFPLQSYAQRGPLVAWTPHLAGVAVKLDRKPAEGAPLSARRKRHLATAGGLLLAALVVALLAANLWATLSLRHRVALAGHPASAGDASMRVREPPAPVSTVADEDFPERFTKALYDLLQEQAGSREWGQTQNQLLVQYERVAAQHRELRLRDTNIKGKMALGAVGVLAQRSADRVEELVKKALSNKGYDPKLIQLAGEHVHEHLLAEARGKP
jgi:hypothetical protein